MKDTDSPCSLYPRSISPRPGGPTPQGIGEERQGCRLDAEEVGLRGRFHPEEHEASRVVLMSLFSRKCDTVME